MQAREEDSLVAPVGRAAILVRSALSLAAAAALASLLPSCGGGREGVQQFETVRVTAGSGPELRFNASSSERFGFGLTVGAGARTGAERGTEGSDGQVPTAGSAAGLVWDLPEGWREAAPTSMRTANFEPRPGTDASAYLTLLAGEGGGLAANVNRWRSQLGLGPLSADELAALPRQHFLDGDAVRVDFEGTFGGMGGDRAEAGYRIVGLLRITEAGSAFLKFVGPTEIVQAELTAFDRLALSFRPEAPAAAPAAPEPDVLAVDLGANSRAGSDSLSWTAPEGWERMPDRMLREVTFQAGAVECYVASLPGDAGGVRANFDRWRGQLGAAPLSEAEFEALASLEMLGATARRIQIDGDFTGMRGETLADARMLGVVCFLGDRTIFVKLVGPADEVVRESEAFDAFCRSLEVTR